MASASGVVAILALALLTVASWALVRHAIRATRPGARAQNVPAMEQPSVMRAYRGEARAALTALVLGVAVAALLCGIGTWLPRGYGIAYGLAGGVGAIVGLAAYTLLPRPSWRTHGDGPVVAELSPRRPTSFARQWVFALPAASAAALVAGLVLTGLVSATDENGLHRVFQRRSLSGWAIEGGRVVDVQYGLSSSGPFPGWYYGVPVILCTGLLVAAVYWSLFRTARAPRPVSADLFAADTALRTLRTQFIMSASSAALAFQVAGLAAITGSVLRGAHLESVPTADVDAVPAIAPVEPGFTLALVLILSALVIAAVAVVLLVRAAGIIAELWAAGSGSGDRLDLAGTR